MPNSRLFQLAYTSVAARALTREELFALFRKSSQNNSSRGITGMLLYMRGSFLQLLEGDEEAVMNRMLAISSDKRHRQITPIHFARIPVREFDRWTMSFRGVKAEDMVALPGLTAFADEGLDITETDPSRGKLLLDAFRSGHWSAPPANLPPLHNGEAAARLLRTHI